MRIIIKLALLPVVIFATVAWLIALLASKIFGMVHGFLWALLLIPIILACCLQMWQNAAIFAAVGFISYLLLFGLTAAEVLLDTVRHSVCAFISS